MMDCRQVQPRIADYSVGLLRARESEQIEGYHMLVGGGHGPQAVLAREIVRDVKATDVPPLIERLLKAYLAGRSSKEETFLAFTRRHELRRSPNRNARDDLIGLRIDADDDVLGAARDPKRAESRDPDVMETVVHVSHHAHPEHREQFEQSARDHQHQRDDLAPAHRCRSISRANVSPPNTLATARPRSALGSSPVANSVAAGVYTAAPSAATTRAASSSG